MGRPKLDKRTTRFKLRKTHKPRGQYKKYDERKMKKAIGMIEKGCSIRCISEQFNIPRVTLGDEYNNFKKSKIPKYDDYLKQKGSPLILLNDDEEIALEKFALWQQERGMPITNAQMKALMRDVYRNAVTNGEKRQRINLSTGPSANYMRKFYRRHPAIRMRSAETVDRGRINMASKETIEQYFNLLKETLVKLKIADLDDTGNIINESVLAERLYLADETGWGVQSKRKRVLGKKGAPHVYLSKPSDESHKTLMLGLCGNGEVLKSLIILQESFPLIGENEVDNIPDGLLTKQDQKWFHGENSIYTMAGKISFRP